MFAATKSFFTNEATAGGLTPSWVLDFSVGTPSGYTLIRSSSGTYVDSSGYIALASTDVARLTHNSSGSRLGLLVEEQRTNYVQRSGEFENAYWGDTTGTTCSGVGSPSAPDNSSDTAELKETTGSSAHYRGAYVNPAFTNGSVYTFTAYLKKGTRQYCGLYILHISPNTGYTVLFDLDNGTVADAASTGTPNGVSSIEPAGNGWYRCRVTFTAAANATRGFGVFMSNRSTLTGSLSTFKFPNYTGSTTETLNVWGLQMEDNQSTPSSYIPTTNSSVTRSADISYVLPIDVTNFGRPGSFVVEYYRPSNQSGHVVVAQDDLFTNGRLGVAYSAGGPRIIYGTTSAGIGGTDVAGLNKIGWGWDGSGAATRSALNGASLDTSLPTSFLPSAMTSIGLGGNVSDPSTLPITVSEQPNVILRKISFYNFQLSVSDLNTLTA